MEKNQFCTRKLKNRVEKKGMWKRERIDTRQIKGGFTRQSGNKTMHNDDWCTERPLKPRRVQGSNAERGGERI